MGEVFEYITVFGQQPVQHRRAVILVPVPQDVVMRPGHQANRIELDIAEPPDGTQHIEWAGGCRGQTLRREPQPAGIAIVDF